MIQVKNLACRLVWDGTDEVRVPPEMGTPRADQMRGTVGERLAELAMRVCYDSLGKGRSSEDAHKHLRCSDAADAEIRLIFCKVLEVLKTSRYGKAFDDFKLQPASDGIGFSLAGGGYK